MRKRLFSLCLACLLLWTALPALAEETPEDDTNMDVDTSTLSEAELAEIHALDDIDENDEEPKFVVGETWKELDVSDVTKNTPVLYTCRIIKSDIPIYSVREVDKTKVIIRTTSPLTAELYSVGSNWCVVKYKNKIGYIKREKLKDVEPVDPVNTPPYGVQKASYIATTATEAHVRKSMSDQDDNWVVLNPGTRLSIWRLLDGWAIVHYWRTYGYIRVEELKDLIPVSPTDTPLRADTPIAAYTSFYSMAQNDTNMNRLENIAVGCKRLSRVMRPGESFNFNKQVGPYNARSGYKPAVVLTEGTAALGYGGGTCQVSSTLYNALIQLPGIAILQRRPHGPSGAKYLPHGVDAAVGNDNLNLRFRNDYEFPIRIEGHTSYDGALLMLVYRADLQ